MTSRIGALSACVVLAAVVATPLAADAAIVIYSGSDQSATGPANKPNSDAARASFLAALGGYDAFTTTFEEGPTGELASYDLVGGATVVSTKPSVRPLTVLSASRCAFGSCGGNTTTGGSNFLDVRAAPLAFTFDAPISAFGAYFTGGDTLGIKLVFDDGTTQSILVPAVHGSTFLGFTDFGRQITAITFDPGTDFMGMDDITFASAAVPEPMAWSLMIAGFGLAGATVRTRRRARLVA